MNKYILEIIVFAIFGIVLGSIWYQWSDCSNNGGVLVRGLFWFECVDK